MDPFKPYVPSKRPQAAPALTADDAQAVALKAIAFIAADEEMLSRFAALSGCGLEELRGQVANPAFLGGVLDFILGDEPTLLAFTDAMELAPETPMMARMKLP